MGKGRLGSMKRLLAMLIWFPLISFAEEPAEGSLVRPYYDCMKSETEKYSRSADRVDDAIVAAGASCGSERKKLMAAVIVEMILRGPSAAKDDAEGIAVEAVSQIDIRMRPALVKAALDARNGHIIN